MFFGFVLMGMIAIHTWHITVALCKALWRLGCWCVREVQARRSRALARH